MQEIQAPILSLAALAASDGLLQKTGNLECKLCWSWIEERSCWASKVWQIAIALRIWDGKTNILSVIFPWGAWEEDRVYTSKCFSMFKVLPVLSPCCLNHFVWKKRQRWLTDCEYERKKKALYRWQSLRMSADKTQKKEKKNKAAKLRFIRHHKLTSQSFS